MGTIKTTNIEPIADNGTVTLGSSGDTFTLGSGVLQSNMLYPAFLLEANTTQTISHASFTKATNLSEVFDTDNAVSSQRFTVPTGKAGKYILYGSSSWPGNGSGQRITSIYKNGSEVLQNGSQGNASSRSHRYGLSLSLTVDMNGSSDYLEMYVYLDNSGTDDGKFEGDSISFGAFRVGT